MAANTSINVASLDFDAIKLSLKNFMKSQPQFADYNFDGSNMSVLLDVLSYNTYLNAFYTNMAISESFLDSAQLRNSAVSRAKELNYVPVSARSSKAILSMSFQSSTNAASVTIPAKTKFSAQNSNGSWTFVTDTNRTFYPSGNAFSVSDLTVYEGAYVTDTFAVDYSVENQRFLLTNENIDTSSISVSVVEDLSSNGTLFIKADTLYGLTSTSNAYFIQGAEDYKYEVVFGDGVFGRRPNDSSVVIVEYRTTSGNIGDGSVNFTLDDDLGLVNNTITQTTSSYGGGDAESVDSIRMRAPRHFQTQQRAVTGNDYRDIVIENYPDVKNVHVFGGETVSSSVQYGRTFVVPISKSGYALSDTEKSDIQSFLNDRCTIGIRPEVIDPNYLYLLTNILVKYDSTKTSLLPNDIKSLVSTAVSTYNLTYLNDFNTFFKFSRLEAAINDADASISSNELRVQMRKDVFPTLNSAFYPTVYFNNPIIPGSVYSTKFLSGGREYQYTDYNPNNNTFQISQLSGGSINVTNETPTLYLKDVTTPGYESYTSVGSIDYVTGTVTSGSISINDLLTAGKLSFYATCSRQDIYAVQNNVILIDDEAGINVTVTTI